MTQRPATAPPGMGPPDQTDRATRPMSERGMKGGNIGPDDLSKGVATAHGRTPKQKPGRPRHPDHKQGPCQMPGQAGLSRMGEGIRGGVWHQACLM